MLHRLCIYTAMFQLTNHGYWLCPVFFLIRRSLQLNVFARLTSLIKGHCLTILYFSKIHLNMGMGRLQMALVSVLEHCILQLSFIIGVSLEARWSRKLLKRKKVKAGSHNRLLNLNKC